MVRVIVVDDETDIFPLFKIKFKKEISKDQIKFSFFTNPQDVVKFLHDNKKDHFNFILSDISMPEQSGLDLLREIKSINKKQQVYMLSAHSHTSDQDKARKLGADGFLTKPVDFHILRDLFFQRI